MVIYKVEDKWHSKDLRRKDLLTDCGKQLPHETVTSTVGSIKKGYQPRREECCKTCFPDTLPLKPQ